MDERLAKLEAQVDALERRVVKLDHLLIGVDGTNGVRSEIRAMRSDLKDLANQVGALQKVAWTAAMIPSVAVAVVALLKFIGKL
ncbi:MAG: hypothetical protein Q7P63_01140 [Verrucomicrobiota bacterium JB022]|nr:hypothetical protein [Verrucomicrobiota bacterium JB022]